MLEIQDIFKSYEGLPLLNGVSLRVEQGEIVGLLGASGSGKSTLLRIISGLETAERGQVLWAGQDLASVPAHERGIGLVFQDYALFPHLRVAANVGYGLKLRKLDPQDIQVRVAGLLELVDLAGFELRRVNELSGGEQQRVALARALAIEPRLLLFDEPLGALDRTLREHLLAEIRRILRKSAVPAIYVTHDQEEAFALADRVALLHNGCIVRQGTPDQVWADPGSCWAAEFLGAGNLLAGEVHDSAVHTEWGDFPIRCGHSHVDGERVHLLLRRDGARLDPDGPFKGLVADVLFQKDHYQVRLDNGLDFHLRERLRPGERVGLRIPESLVRCLGNEDDRSH